MVSGSITSTKQFFSSEERDASGIVTKIFFARGVVIGGTNYYYERDHLGSVRQLTDASGNVVSSYSFRPYGEKCTLTEAVSSDIQYAGYYFHARSGLSLTAHRAYEASKATWLSQDPLEEDGGDNLYAYVGGNPISRIDPLGLDDVDAHETNRIIKLAGDDASGMWTPIYSLGYTTGVLNLIVNSAITFDFGYKPLTTGNTYCVQGWKLSSFQFANFLAGYSAQVFDSIYAPYSQAASRSALGIGKLYHLLSAGAHKLGIPADFISVGWDDPYNKRGKADILTGAAYARDPSAALLNRSKYKKCCTKK